MNLQPLATAIFSSAFLLTSGITSAGEMTTKWPFAIAAQIPEDAEAIGWQSGTRLGLGVFVVSGDSPVKNVKMRNLNSGVTLEVVPLEPVSDIFSAGENRPIIYTVLPLPPFDPEEHMGVWEVIVTDEEGKTVVDHTHDLDKAEPLPFVEDVGASGEPLRPTVTWKEPDQESVPEWCRKQYRVRLLKDPETQLHRSKPLIEAKYEIPDGILKEEDLTDTYIRVEFNCYDNEDNEHPVPLESKADTFVPLEDLLKWIPLYPTEYRGGAREEFPAPVERSLAKRGQLKAMSRKHQLAAARLIERGLAVVNESVWPEAGIRQI